jgi:hypothetical protein
MLHVARIEGVHPDALPAPLQRKRPHHLVDPALGYAIGQQAGKADQAGIRRGHDDRAALALPRHLPRRRLGAEEIAPDIHRQHLAQGVGIDLLGRLRQVDAGIAMHDVEPAEALHRRLDQALAIRRPGGVEREPDRLAPGGADLVGRALRFGKRARAGDDGRAGRGHALGDRASEAAARSGDDRDLPGQAEQSE